MTKNYIFFGGIIRGEWVNSTTFRAKSVDALKKKLCQKIDKVCLEQNKKKEVKA